MNIRTSRDLSRTDKILIVLFKLSKGTKKSLHYENIVVALFKKYPSDFAMRGYPQYPDTEGVNHEFYRGAMKKSGLINYSNKIFSLTDKGINHVEKIQSITNHKKITQHGKMPRFVEQEIERVKKNEGFRLFLINHEDQVTDTDFFNYLGLTSRAQKSDFEARLETLKDVIKTIKAQKKMTPVQHRIVSYHDFLVSNKFRNIISYYISGKKHE